MKSQHLVLGLLIATSVGAALPTAKAAATELPEFTVASNSTATAGAGKLNMIGAGIKATSAAGTLTTANKKEGTASVNFKGSTLGGEECKDEGGTEAGVIHTSGKYYVVAGASAKDLALLEPLVATKIECKFAATKVEIFSGTGAKTFGVLGELKTKGVKGTSFELSINAKGSTQEFSSYLDDSGVAHAVKLEGKDNFGQGTAGLELSSIKITTEKETELVK